jgi:DNA-binding transcriptional ArsR family regulator
LAFAALADETRFRTVRLLAATGSSLTPSQIAAALSIKPSHLSRHLQLLEAASLTRKERSGRSYAIELCDNAVARSLLTAVLAAEDDDETLAEDLVRLAASWM